MTEQGRKYDVQDVINAEFNLEPLMCRACGSTEVTFYQYQGDANCAACGKDQLNLPIRTETPA